MTGLRVPSGPPRREVPAARVRGNAPSDGAPRREDDARAAARGPAPGSRAGEAGSRTGIAGWLRWGWRQLTSMRTALVLLFLLAVASVPGSVLPQQGIDPAAVTQYYAAHPALAPILARFSLFNVFAAPWFAAIYLLLFASLAGCVLPRTFRLVGSARQQPPRAPRHLSRLPMAASYTTALEPAAATAAAGQLLAGKRFRLRTGEGWISAEKGYLREVGNLLFHIALLALLASVGLGAIFGYKANRLLVAGSSFANTPTSLDVFRPGRLVTPADLAPFSITLNRFTAKYVTSGNEVGEPLQFNAALRYTASPGAPARRYTLQVNHPLVVDGVSVYIIGHGYAPEFKVTDGAGQVVFNGAVPFIPVDQSDLTSEGVVKVPDASPDQLGFAGVFLPTAVDNGGRLESVFPAALDPRVSLVTYAGNLGLNSGQPQSVYQLDTGRMRQLPIAPRPLSVGQSLKLPGRAGTLTFTGYKPWISLAITYDPGQKPALISGILALAGLILSFMVRRRRFFVRAGAGPDGATVVELGGLARSDAAGGFEEEFAELTDELQAVHQGRDRALSRPAADPGAAAAVDGETIGAESGRAAASPASASSAAAGTASAGARGDMSRGDRQDMTRADHEGK
jgi:cytochrome c biogenesis protein